MSEQVIEDRGEGVGGAPEAAGLERLACLAAQEAALYAARAEQLHACSGLSRRLQGHHGPDRFLVIDLAGTLRIGQQAADRAAHEASRLVQVLPGTLAGLRSARVFVAQATIVLQETSGCSEPVAREVDRRLHAGAPDGLEGWIARRLCARLRRLVLLVEAELEPQLVGERERRARAGRRVSVRAEPDGMASLWALLPAEQLRAFTVGLDELHRRQIVADRLAGVERTADQRRADLLALLPAPALHALASTAPTGTAPTGTSPTGTALAGSGPFGLGQVCPSLLTAVVHVPLATALGLSQAPGELVGYGPVSAAQARQVLSTATLQRLVVDDVTGEPIRTRTTPSIASEPAMASDAGAAAERAVARGRERLRRLLTEDPLTPADLADPVEPQHDPSAALARFVQLRDPLCTAPGCSMSSPRCDLDHEDPWPQGPTAARNLRPKSRRCHRAKTFSWTVRRTADGAHHWTSPTGRTYRVPPSWDPPPVPRAGTPSPPPPTQRVLDTTDDIDLTNQLDTTRAHTPAEPPTPPTPAHTCSASCEPPF